MAKYQKPFVPCSGILDPKSKDPDGYVSNDGTWAAVPYAGKQKGFAIIDNGNAIQSCNTQGKQAMDYISKKAS